MKSVTQQSVWNLTGRLSTFWSGVCGGSQSSSSSSARSFSWVDWTCFRHLEDALPLVPKASSRSQGHVLSYSLGRKPMTVFLKIKFVSTSVEQQHSFSKVLFNQFLCKTCLKNMLSMSNMRKNLNPEKSESSTER